tara:strand:- start:14344 stop:14514 length:171 start_codon:yes stop_codon:yes gene_type:complete
MVTIASILPELSKMKRRLGRILVLSVLKNISVSSATVTVELSAIEKPKMKAANLPV